MGQMVQGRWQVDEQLARLEAGRFARPESVFRHTITEPRAGERFEATAGRYHLYVSLACPWAHRTLIMRRLKGLDRMISCSVTHWEMREQGWNFQPGPGVVPDTVNGVRFLHELYARADPRYSGRVTVPILWDRKQSTIVNNESSEILRMFNSAFDTVGALAGDYYPEAQRAEIDAVNARVYQTLNNGVYRCGFAGTQAAYDEAAGALFETLDWLEDRLGQQRFVAGSRLTEADIRLFVTLVRFDPVYHSHFKCSRRRLVDYPNLWAYTRDLWQQPGFGETVDLRHIRHHYFGSQRTVNPTGIVPLSPVIDFDAPQDRAARFGAG